MKYVVIIQSRAKNDLRRAFFHAARHAPLAAEKWLDRIQSKVLSLARCPDKFHVVQESARLPFVFVSPFMVVARVVIAFTYGAMASLSAQPEYYAARSVR